MRDELNILVVSTPLGFIGSGRGGGIELTVPTIVGGLLSKGHSVTVLAGEGSTLPPDCESATLWTERGEEQPPWQHSGFENPVLIPHDGLLPKFWSRALKTQGSFDAIINLSYDWLPYWLSLHVPIPVFHIVTMGSVSAAMTAVIQQAVQQNPSRVAFFSATQSADFPQVASPVILGNGLDLRSYVFRELPGADPFWGWAGRIAPEKGLEDAARAAAKMGYRLRVWGLVCDENYRRKVEDSVPDGTIEWRGLLSQTLFQQELGEAQVFLNTPKWNEAYGNVVIEALACGVPVVAYRRGGPREIILDGYNGFLCQPDCYDSLGLAAARAASEVPRQNCRTWVERFASHAGFTDRIESWLLGGL